MKKLTLTAATLALLGLTVIGAHAATTTFRVTSNGYVRISGGYDPITSTAAGVDSEGPSDPNDAPAYEDYGLLDLTGASTGPLSNVTNLVFNAYDDGSKYENKGLIDFYLVTNPGAIGTGLTIDPTVVSNPVGVSAASQSALGLISLGSYNFAGINGYDSPISASLNLSAAALAAFEKEAAAGNIGLLFTADASTPGAAMTLDTFNSKYTTADAPEALSFTATPAAGTAAVPEASSYALLSLGMLPVVLVARKRRAAK